MNRVECLDTLGLADFAERLEFFEKLFLKQNSMLNLISKNDEKLLFEKHIFDSLAINLFLKDKTLDGKRLLDIGTGGGFPALPISICFDKIKVFALDSIRKKINSIEQIKSEMHLKNLVTICERAEKVKGKYDIITSRAVAKLETIAGYAIPLLKNDGVFVAYKSRLVQEEIAEAKNILKGYNVSTIAYKLPLDELYERYLVVIQK